MQCADHGLLRAYLDDALPPPQRAELATHVVACAACREHLSMLRTSAAQVSALLGPPAQLADPPATFARLKSRLGAQAPLTQRKPAIPPQRWTAAHRPWLAAAGTALVLVSLLLFPPLRAAADELLQIFRVREVVFFPIDPARVSQIEALEGAGATLFVGEPVVLNKPAPPRDVASVDEASQAVGFPVRTPMALPETSAEHLITVRDRTVLSMYVNVDALRQLLAIATIDDVTMPAALDDAPITVDVRSWVLQRYAGEGWRIELYQGYSPDVTLPEGVDGATLGRIGLRVLGLSAADAERISRQIDWTSTLVVPIPPQVQDVRSVMVNGRAGLLVSMPEEDGQSWLLYWQEEERFYILEASGALNDAAVLTTANSLR